MHQVNSPHSPYAPSRASNQTALGKLRILLRPLHPVRTHIGHGAARLDDAFPVLGGQPANDRRVAALRFLLSLATLWSSLGVRPSLGLELELVLVGVYVGVCAVAFVATRRDPAAESRLNANLPALDVLVYASLVVANGPLDGTFLCGLLFATAVISAAEGAKTGEAVVAFTATASLLRIAFQPAPFAVPTAEILAGAVAVAALGTALARWADAASRRARMAAFLSDLSETSRFRQDEERRTRHAAESMRRLFDADGCVLVLPESTGTYHGICRRGRAATGPRSAVYEDLEPALAERLLSSAGTRILVYGPTTSWLGSTKRSETLVVDPCRLRTEARAGYDIEPVASLLDASAILSAPIPSDFGAPGRVYLVWTRPRRLDAEVPMLVRAAGHLASVLDDVRGSDRLGLAVAAKERARIARDLHDTTIQSFIGLQIGLTAVRAKLETDGGGVSADVTRLIHLTEMEIGDMRGYVERLRSSGGRCTAFRSTVDRFVEKYSSATGIAVEVKVEGDLTLSGSFAAEAFQLIAEGLSNVRRHTRSPWARVRMSGARNVFSLEIENESPANRATAFRPRSISERTAALGGRVHVDCGRDGATCVRICIPL